MKYILSLLILILIAPVVTHAETVLRAGDNISVEAEQVVEGDYYVSVGPMGSTIMSGVVTEDMYAVGAAVTVNGDVGADLSIFSATSQLHASVTDDVRIIGGEVTIAEAVGGDVFVLAGSLHILSSAAIAGNVYFFGGELDIAGDIAGSVFGKAERVRVDATIGGDLDMTAAAGLTLGSNTDIAGSVTYRSYMPLVRDPDVVIQGAVVKNEFRSTSIKEQAQDLLIPVFITLFAGLTLFLLFKEQLQRLVATVDTSFLKSVTIGTSVALLGPVAAMVLIVTILGLFIGLLMLTSVFALYIAGVALTCVTLGAFMVRLYTKKLEVSLLSIVIGATAVHILLAVPVFGVVVVLVVFLVTVGALVQNIFRVIT